MRGFAGEGLVLLVAPTSGATGSETMAPIVERDDVPYRRARDEH
jgi:hypothetical protein